MKFNWIKEADRYGNVSMARLKSPLGLATIKTIWDYDYGATYDWWVHSINDYRCQQTYKRVHNALSFYEAKYDAEVVLMKRFYGEY